MRRARLSAGPHVAGLSAGQPAAAVPARRAPERGCGGGGGGVGEAGAGWSGKACVQPSNNQHSREAHSLLLLLFTTVYFLLLFTASPLKAITSLLTGPWVFLGGFFLFW